MAELTKSLKLECFSWSLTEKGKQMHMGHTDIKINYTESHSKRQVGSLSLLKVEERKEQLKSMDNIRPKHITVLGSLFNKQYVPAF